MFRASAPVTASSFVNRRRELAHLTQAFEALVAGAPKWLAIIGRRKVGKTSLLLEAARQVASKVAVVVLDAFEHQPLTPDVFRVLLLRVLDGLLGEAAGGSFERAAESPEALGRLLDRALPGGRATADLRSELRELVARPARATDVRRLLQLPEDLARHLDRHLVVAIDEVQELAELGSGKNGFDPFPVMRAVWQRHERVAYVISGSAPSVIEALVTSRRSPFFQHFEILHLEAFARADAVKLLVDHAPEGHPIPKALAERVADVLGNHPFYLQLAGEALTSSETPLDEGTLKQVLQGLVFSRTGRLGLFFENEHRRLIGSSSTLAATLDAAARGPLRLTDIARATRSSTASTARYVERLGDVLVRQSDGMYQVADPVFAAWLRWRGSGGAVVPMRVLGDEAEIAVAERLSEMGFDLVYQSRASRGAFDLLALRGAAQLGVQVKRSALPLRFTKSEWNRMDADAERWGWRWVIAAVEPGKGEVRILDPGRASAKREVRLDEGATIENLLAWLDGG